MMSTSQIKALEYYITSIGKGLFEDVKVTVDEYNWINVGIYVDWQYFPKNHGVYKLNDSFLKKLQDNINIFLKMLGVKKQPYSYYTPISIEIKNNFNEQPINEVERDWRDEEYEEQYSRISNKLINSISEMFESYYEDDKVIHLYGNNDKRLMTYYKNNNELFFNRDIIDYITELIPPFIWARHGKYLMSDMFEEMFPEYKVRDVISAGMN